MVTLISFCDLQWWQVILILLISFFLGYIIAWLLWGKYKKRYKLLANEKDDYKQLSEDLLNKIEDCEKEVKILKSKKQKGISGEKRSGSKQSALTQTSALADDIFSKLDPDNLQIIEGIGPKMSEFLHNKGISNWEILGKSDPQKLSGLLDNEGTKYRIIDPSSWPQQASLAAKGKWEELIDFQKNLASGKNKDKQVTDSKVEKIMTRMGLLKKWKKDDLKAVEGIGPKIESLLKESGIQTWEQLSSSKSSALKEILAKGGSKFQLADPTTWPEQAALAAKGDWKRLTLLQDQLKGGRKK